MNSSKSILMARAILASFLLAIGLVKASAKVDPVHVNKHSISAEPGSESDSMSCMCDCC